MKSKCKHCGTSFTPQREAEAFCCTGCLHVYELIRREGLDTYYALQDRVGRPVGQRDQARFESLQTVQSKVERESGPAHLVLRVSGMSCLGCLWLVERVARGMDGCRSAQASLQSGTLVLSWTPGVFQLQALGERLWGFGYSLEERSGEARSWSPLAWRSLICAVLAGNGLFLAGLRTVLGESPAVGLVELLLWVVLALAALVGLPHFVMPVIRAAGMRSMHSDGLLCVGWLLLIPMQLVAENPRPVWLLPLSLAMLLLGRAAQVRLWQSLSTRLQREWRVHEALAEQGRRLLHVNVCFVLLALIACWVAGAAVSPAQAWSSAASVCFVFSLHPLAIAARYGFSLPLQLSGYLLGWVGVGLIFFGLLNVVTAILWMVVTGSAWLCGAVWRIPNNSHNS